MVFLFPVRIRILSLLYQRGFFAYMVENYKVFLVTLRAVLLKGFQAAPLQIKFLVVSSMVPQIFVVGLVNLVAETVVNVVELVLCQLLFQFVIYIFQFFLMLPQ